MPDLTAVSSIDQDPASFVRSCGTVVREFDHLTQDSGNVSWLVATPDRRLFVKTAGTAGPPAPGAPVPCFDHAGRVRLLRNAVELASSCQHPALPPLLNVIESPSGPLLVYAEAQGELVHVPADERGDLASAYQRFAHLPAPVLLDLLDTLIDVHLALSAAGWVASDLYDGCLVVDFDRAALAVIDLDSYRRGPFRNDMGRMVGSTRFMAPEELELGEPIDERTTVFTLGRIVWHFATRLSERRADFCGIAELAGVVERACRPSRSDRWATVAELAEAWNAAIAGGRQTTDPTKRAAGSTLP